MGRSEGKPVVTPDGPRQTTFAEQALQGWKRELLAVGFQRFTQKQVARGIVGDGQRITIAFVAQLKLALVIGAPEIVGMKALGQRPSFGSTTAPADRRDQPVAIEHGVNGRSSGSLDGMGKSPKPTLSVLACAPLWFLLIGDT